MLTADDIRIIEGVVNKAVAPLATSLSSLDTKITKLDVKMTGQFSELKSKMTKNVKRLENCVMTERKLRNDDFGHLEKEDRKISLRVEKIEHHLSFAPAS